MSTRRPLRALQQRGFSLIELMVVVTLVAIMLAIGVPSFNQFTATQRVKSAAFDFASSLLQARSEAIKRNASVTLQQNTGGWAYGWTVAVGGTTIGTQEPLGSVTVSTSPSGTASIVFANNGRTTAASNVKFQFGSADAGSVRCVTVNTSGVPNTTSTSCS